MNFRPLEPSELMRLVQDQDPRGRGVPARDADVSPVCPKCARPLALFDFCANGLKEGYELRRLWADAADHDVPAYIVYYVPQQHACDACLRPFVTKPIERLGMLAVRQVYPTLAYGYQRFKVPEEWAAWVLSLKDQHHCTRSIPPIFERLLGKPFYDVQRLIPSAQEQLF